MRYQGRLAENDTANLPNDFGKSRKEKIMGGFGSGRGQVGKDTTEDSRPLDIRKLNRSGLLQPGRSFGWQWTVNDRPVGDIGIRVEVEDRKSTRLNSSHRYISRMPSSA
jgi:hypothetical protein